ncbi:MAG: sigma-54-dependent Fis family transcriptional regulator [Desulfomonile tiedjei]|nr:sigma-54-dependent Fis family transcriptional regulator [Desulfomonile tiedjei]
MMQRGGRILIVDDEKDICEILFRLLKKSGFMPLVAHDGERALEMIRLGVPDAVVSDMMMPGMDGMELLRRAKEYDPTLPFLIITGYGGIDGAVRAMKEGAFDYLPKPLNNKELVDKIRLSLETRQSARKTPTPSDTGEGSEIARLQEMMGPSAAVQRIAAEAALVARSNFSVIIQGETGTGKELVARAIHKSSPRSAGPMIPVDCGAIPETLFESELFGYEKGAFTGAAAMTPGKFELAQHGTLFLDEIGNMPLSSQIKLLRAIQERSFFRVGGRKPVTVDLRLIVASNQDLNASVAAGSFSRDLFYRLSEFTILIPPVRDRKQDIIHLANRFLIATNVELAKKVKGFSESALNTMTTYGWPGNVRQIKSVVRRAVLIAEELVTPEHLSLGEVGATSPENDAQIEECREIVGLPLKEAVQRATAEVERRCLIDALKRTGGNKSKAARLLQIDRKTMHSKIKEYDIRPDEDASE